MLQFKYLSHKSILCYFLFKFKFVPSLVPDGDRLLRSCNRYLGIVLFNCCGRWLHSTKCPDMFFQMIRWKSVTRDVIFSKRKKYLKFLFCWKLLRCWLQFHRDAKISRCLVLSSGRAVGELQEGWVRGPPCALRIPFFTEELKSSNIFQIFRKTRQNSFNILPSNGYGENGCVNFFCEVPTFCKK